MESCFPMPPSTAGSCLVLIQLYMNWATYGILDQVYHFQLVWQLNWGMQRLGTMKICSVAFFKLVLLTQQFDLIVLRSIGNIIQQMRPLQEIRMTFTRHILLRKIG